MSDDLPERLRLWTELDKIEAMPLLNYDLLAAADEIGRLRERVVDLEQDVEGTDRLIVRLRDALEQEEANVEWWKQRASALTRDHDVHPECHWRCEGELSDGAVASKWTCTEHGTVRYVEPIPPVGGPDR